MNGRILRFCQTVALLTVSAGMQAQTTYTDGVFMLNEDWFGHNNSTINFLRPENDVDPFEYYIIQNNEANAGQSLGCTAQFGAIYGDNIYIISKQDQDGGERGREGGRIVVADARTMEIKKRIPVIMTNKEGKSIADGRGFVGVNEKKGYVGSSNGIYILNLETYDIVKQIEGTENPLITGDEVNSDGIGPLYQNQIGMMLRTSDYVFAIQQDKGVLVIDPETDKIIKTIEGCFCTMVQSKDGNIWVGRNTNMDYQDYPYGEMGASGECWEGKELLRIDPSTFETRAVPITVGGLNQTWYAWTAGSLCASTHRNVLYFTFNEDKWSWFTTSKMYEYDIDSDTFTQIYDSSKDERFFYGAGIRINPLDDKIYGALYLDNNRQDYWVYQMDNAGNILQEFEPIQRYWFPALFIFPDKYAPEVKEFTDITLKNGTEEINLTDMASDKDNQDIAIVKTIQSISNENVVAASIKNNRLKLIPKAIGDTEITIRFDSNGKYVDRILQVHSQTTGVQANETEQIEFITGNGGVQIKGLTHNAYLTIYNTQGVQVYAAEITSDEVITGLSKGHLYVAIINNQTYKLIY
ncbi:DUF5074 domain-containing protein [Oscillospiraceae bacterium N12]|jgi:hypothetical protein|uniref:DUF5074 domain-containing protein n=1 Tax=Jilunia laotingensis TaxID=2763675 RepID=A0A926IKB5_9BACT|nr:DUF5074 domain-containing protein [Jilunia laotingensis]MBC8593727.1 DUF5074 domain-containing protein [Jilunia laotingensis]